MTDFHDDEGARLLTDGGRDLDDLTDEERAAVKQRASEAAADAQQALDNLTREDLAALSEGA